MAEHLNGQIAFGIWIPPFSRMDAEAVEGFEGAVPEFMGVFGIRVEVAETWYHEPFVDTGASICDVVVAEDHCQANCSAQEDILQTSKERARIFGWRRRGRKCCSG